MSPAVELVIGFIETYQDPHGVRGSWEGIVAITNLEQSKQFKELTERSLEFIAQLPWNGTKAGLDANALSGFDSQNFIMPDFTSLDTVAYGKSEACTARKGSMSLPPAMNSSVMPGDTWYGVFGADANGVEECRAEGVGLLFVANKSVLEVFGYTDTSEVKADESRLLPEVRTLATLLTREHVVINGVNRIDEASLHFSGAFRRPAPIHSTCIIETGESIKISLNASKIRSHAIPVLEKLLLGLQVYRSTADVERGVALLNNTARLMEPGARYRSIIAEQKELRIQYVQPNIVLDNGKLEVRVYPATMEGLIQSRVERSV
ncbi:peptidase family M49-domain-containing protein [Podospora aff. communis PSN243]|uniref:Peptidase family M49-domain-containing protein n=1 Tax=Podospora aff. communis PSN243 TaxID=3040156 RepID=A0AAV9GBH1_9PEZI|nr:peptidase family M49-domain-containing protein [Podospora aff. communis PSN243]